MSKHLHNLANDWRWSNDDVKKFVKIRLSGRPIETLHCDKCYNEGIVYTQSSEDDFDKDVCEICEHFDIKSALRFVDEVQAVFGYLNKKSKKGGEAHVRHSVLKKLKKWVMEKTT